MTNPLLRLSLNPKLLSIPPAPELVELDPGAKPLKTDNLAEGGRSELGVGRR